MTGKIQHRQLITAFANDNPSVAALQFIRDDPEGFQITDFSAHGMMNIVLRVRAADGAGSVIIKYGESTSRLPLPEQLDKNEEVSLERQVTEYKALKLLDSMQPGQVPRPYCLDRTHNIIAMGDMSSWDLLGIQLQAGKVDLQAATSLGRLLANIHVKTSRKHVTAERWEELCSMFNDESAQKESSHFMFERTYDVTDGRNFIPEPALLGFQESVKDVKEMGLPEKLVRRSHTKECIIHADCHWKSIFVKDGESALLDFEFVFIGAAVQNAAWPITAYLFCYNDEKRNEAEKKRFQTECVQAAKNMLEAYIDTDPDLRNDETNRRAFLKDVALFLGGALVLLGTYFAMDEFNYHTDANRIFLFTRGFQLLKSHEKTDTLDKLLTNAFQP